MESTPDDFPSDEGRTSSRSPFPLHHPSASFERASTPTMTSEDSETVLLNSIPQADSERPPPLSRTSTLGIKKCWICVGDSTEDDPVNPPIWRSPCSCSLTAHEACLLDWVADLENPSNRRSRPTPSAILCPQCKSEIKIARPQSRIVGAVKAVDRSVGRLVLPGLGASLLGTIFAGCWVHGFQSVYLVFGEADAQRIFHYASTHSGAIYTYSLIPINLVFSRTRYADFVLPSSTLYLLSTQLNDGFEIDWTVWPPLPSTVFACLPALRSFYNWCYGRAFGELNRKWLREVQPRREEGFEGQEQNIANIMNEQEQQVDADNDNGGGGIVLELEVNMGVDDDAAEAPQVAGNAANNNGNGGGEQEANVGQVHHILGDRGDEIMEGTSSIGQNVIGALMFPAVSAGIGQLLSYALPSSWLSYTNFSNGRPGLLRTRWGRSVVGGCLFVVMKDAIMLYCRWKMAQSHRQRKIMDYNKLTKQYVDSL